MSKSDIEGGGSREVEKDTGKHRYGVRDSTIHGHQRTEGSAIMPYGGFVVQMQSFNEMH